MESKKDITTGSATIMVMMVMLVLVLIGTTAFNTSTMLYDLAMQRVTMEQQIRASHALVYYGIACCKVIDALPKKKKEYTYTMKNWPNSGSRYTGDITIVPQKRWYEVKASLLEGKQRIAQSSCFVWKEKTRWKTASFVG